MIETIKYILTIVVFLAIAIALIRFWRQWSGVGKQADTVESRIQELEDTIRFNAKSAMAHYKLGYLLISNSCGEGLYIHDIAMYERALECFARCMQLEPSNMDCLAVWADSLYKWGEQSGDVLHYQEAGCKYLQLATEGKQNQHGFYMSMVARCQ